MKNIIKITLLSIILILVLGCQQIESSDKRLQEQTESAMQEMNRQIGMPAIKNFQERKLAKMIFELRDQENLITYAYLVNKMTGKLVYLGRCIGYGLPYSVQYTNPEKVAYTHSSLTLPQADPNGLFMPSGLSATWLMMIDESTGKARPVYIEPEIVVSPFKL